MIEGHHAKRELTTMPGTVRLHRVMKTTPEKLYHAFLEADAQEGIPEAIPLEACYLGWRESLRNLTKLVEPDIRQ
jgi:hypothetical protein